MLIAKTELGHRVMRDRSVALTPRQRAVFILVDGKRTLDQVFAATAPTGVTRQDIDKLFELGLIIEAVAQTGAFATVRVQAAGGAAAELPAHGRTPQERYAMAYPIASQLTASLGLRGFRLNLAVEGATSYEQLLEVAPRICEAVGPQRYQSLHDALSG